jgi:hypothetical protein
MEYYNKCINAKEMYLKLKGGAPKLSLSLPVRTELSNKLVIKNYSELSFIKNDITINILDDLKSPGAFGTIYDGTINGHKCLVKVSHDIIEDTYTDDNKCVKYTEQFLELTNELQAHGIIPIVYSFNYIGNFDQYIFDGITYKKSDFMSNIYTKHNECINILCTEKYDCDLVELYEQELLQQNKQIIENMLLEIFGKLTRLRYIYTDMKLENIVVKLNTDGTVIDLKIIDIDPIFCLQFDKFFNFENINAIHDFDHIPGIIISLYKQIFYRRSRGILFSNDRKIKDKYNIIKLLLKQTFSNKNRLLNMYNLLCAM